MQYRRQYVRGMAVTGLFGVHHHSYVQRIEPGQQAPHIGVGAVQRQSALASFPDQPAQQYQQKARQQPVAEHAADQPPGPGTLVAVQPTAGSAHGLCIGHRKAQL